MGGLIPEVSASKKGLATTGMYMYRMKGFGLRDKVYKILTNPGIWNTRTALLVFSQYVLLISLYNNNGALSPTVNFISPTTSTGVKVYIKDNDIYITSNVNYFIIDISAEEAEYIGTSVDDSYQEISIS